jgi:hypothetical protein
VFIPGRPHCRCSRGWGKGLIAKIMRSPPPPPLGSMRAYGRRTREVQADVFVSLRGHWVDAVFGGAGHMSLEQPVQSEPSLHPQTRLRSAGRLPCETTVSVCIV